MVLLEHKHLIVRAEVLAPPRDEKQTSEQVTDLIKRIGMKILMGPYAKYVNISGNRGLTIATIIETSHVVMHTWDETDPAIIQLDVYTCGPLEPQIVIDWLDQYQPVKIDHKYLDREFDIKELSADRPHNYSTKEIVGAMDKILNL